MLQNRALHRPQILRQFLPDLRPNRISPISPLHMHAHRNNAARIDGHITNPDLLRHPAVMLRRNECRIIIGHHASRTRRQPVKNIVRVAPPGPQIKEVPGMQSAKIGSALRNCLQHKRMNPPVCPLIRTSQTLINQQRQTQRISRSHRITQSMIRSSPPIHLSPIENVPRPRPHPRRIQNPNPFHPHLIPQPTQPTQNMWGRRFRLP